MYSPKIVSGTVSRSVADAYGIVRGLASNKPYSVTSEDPAAGKVVFSQGKTMFSWGYEFEVVVTAADGGATVEVTTGGKDGAPRALLDGKKHEKAAKKFFDAVVAAA